MAWAMGKEEKKRQSEHASQRKEGDINEYLIKNWHLGLWQLIEEERSGNVCEEIWISSLTN